MIYLAFFNFFSILISKSITTTQTFIRNKSNEISKEISTLLVAIILVCQSIKDH